MLKGKRLFLIIFIVCFAMVLAGCSSKKKDKAETSDQVTENKEETEDKKDSIQDKENSTNQKDKVGTSSLRVKGSKLVDWVGRTVQLKGLSSHGLAWYPEYVNANVIKQMKKEWNCNVFRVAMYTAESDGYCVGNEANRTKLKKKIDEAVKATKKYDVYLIIDWHILSDNNPQTYQKEAIQFFEEMAKTYKNERHILYEICNEPNGNTTWEDIKSYANEVIPVIRKHTDSVILVGTPTWSQDIEKAAKSPIQNQKNIMYTLHFYAATHKDDLRKKLKSAVKSGLPVFVSEFGICDASGNGKVNEKEADKWLELMNTYQISYVMWNLSNKSESSAMIKTWKTKTGNFKESDLTQTGKWFVDRNTTPTTSDSSAQSYSKPSTYAKKATVTVVADNSWEEGSSTFYKYTTSIDNVTSQKLSNWKIVIEFNQKISINDSWNGKYKVSGKKLTITPVSYNKKIAAGEQLSDLGFVVKGDKKLKVVKTTLK